MSTSTFEKSSWNWQIYRFQQQVEEWLEYKWYSLFSTPKKSPSYEWTIAPWLTFLLKLVFWLLVGLFLGWVIWQLWRELSPYFYSWLAGGSNYIDPSTKVPEKQISAVQLWKRSQQLYLQGNYQQACRHLYLAMLQHLHEQGILPQNASRTDGEYLQLLRASAIQIQPYETLILTHEQLCFGNADIDRENYEQCSQAYKEIANS
jgi:hypothetical protein